MHVMNFIYLSFFNDRIFFESVVRLHLSNKTLKSIVDLWLLSQAIAKTPFTTNPSNDDTIELLHDIKTQSRLTLSSKLGELSKLNIFEQILVLSIADNSGLNSLAKQLKTNIDENPSLSRNNLSWVTIFESCLRRTMLQLNTTLPDNDTDDKEQDAPKKDKKAEMDDNSDDDADISEYSEVEEEQELTISMNECKPSPIFQLESKSRCAPSPPVQSSRGMAMPSVQPMAMMSQQCSAGPSPMNFLSAVRFPAAISAKTLIS